MGGSRSVNRNEGLVGWLTAWREKDEPNVKQIRVDEMDFVLGGMSAVGAVVLTNPMDVVKTRMQLQGELRARGRYTVVYRNFFHAALAIAKVSQGKDNDDDNSKSNQTFIRH